MVRANGPRVVRGSGKCVLATRRDDNEVLIRFLNRSIEIIIVCCYL